MNQNAIVAFAVGYNPGDLDLFIQSIEDNIKGTDLILYVGKNAPKWRSTYQNDPWIKIRRFKENLAAKMISAVIKKDNWVLDLWTATLSWAHEKYGRSKFSDHLIMPLLQFMCKRFIILEKELENTNYSNYMLTDARDVIFQSDPFQELQSNQIITGGEPKKIVDCEHNFKWISTTFADENYLDIIKNQILCAGVTLGSREVMLQYASEMIDIYFQKLGYIVDMLGPDQAVHNWLFYYGLEGVNKEIQNNGKGTIATLHYSDLSEFDITEGQVKNHNNVPLHILHQFDRKDELVEHFSKRYISKLA